MGYDYIAFDDHHFREDLQYEDAVPMFERLLKLAGENGLEFGLTLSNTFPVEVKMCIRDSSHTGRLRKQCR